MSRILVKEDHSGKEHFAECWISKKNNLCWKLGETIFVKLQNGYTSMLVEGNWKRSNIHTTAKVPKAAMPDAEIQKVRLIL